MGEISFCEKCGAQLKPDANYCNKCGNALRGKNMSGNAHTEEKKKSIYEKFVLSKKFDKVEMKGENILVIKKQDDWGNIISELSLNGEVISIIVKPHLIFMGLVSEEKREKAYSEFFQIIFDLTGKTYDRKNCKSSTGIMSKTLYPILRGNANAERNMERKEPITIGQVIVLIVIIYILARTFMS